MVQSQRVPTEWNKDCMCISQLSQVQFSPSGIFWIYFILSNYGTWSHLERVSYSVGAPSTLSFLQLSLHHIQIALIDGRILLSLSFFQPPIHTAFVFFLYNLLSLPFFDTQHILSSTSIVHSFSLLYYSPFYLLLPFVLNPLFPYSVTVSLASVLSVWPALPFVSFETNQPTNHQSEEP